MLSRSRHPTSSQEPDRWILRLEHLVQQVLGSLSLLDCPEDPAVLAIPLLPLIPSLRYRLSDLALQLLLLIPSVLEDLEDLAVQEDQDHPAVLCR
jgi:hypothetical protein